jgi:hypothetical protein
VLSDLDNPLSPERLRMAKETIEAAAALSHAGAVANGRFFLDEHLPVGEKLAAYQVSTDGVRHGEKEEEAAAEVQGDPAV